MDHSRADVVDDLERMVTCSAGSVALGVFGKIVTELLSIQSSMIKSELPNFLTDLTNG